MSTIDIDAMLKRLHLANARRAWRDLCARAEKEDWTYQHLLEVLFSEEVAQRQQTRLSRVTRDAGFPFLKTVDDFDFTFQSTLRISMLGTMLSPDFFTQGQNVVLHGRPGRGKTHPAIPIAYRAIQLGFEARFVTAAELIDDLSGAGAQGRLREALVQYVQPHVLVVDEVGYLAYGDDAANVLFHVVNERHLKRRSMIFTTNKALKKWGRVLHDDDLGDAIVDRVLERGRVLKLDGPSVRSKHVDPADFGDDSQLQPPAEVSGKHRQSFSEPTLDAGDSHPAFNDLDHTRGIRRGGIEPDAVRGALRALREVLSRSAWFEFVNETPVPSGQGGSLSVATIDEVIQFH